MNDDDNGPIEILLVDDRAENLVALKAILRSADYRLVTATSGEEALQLALRGSYAVILLDVVMPRMDGFEVARYLKQADRTRTIPILFLTAVATDVEQIYRAYDVGAVDYLIKPLDPNVVRKKVDVFVELVRQRREIAQQGERLRANERREYELRLAELRIATDSRYRKLVEGIDHALAWSTNAEGRLTFVSRQAQRILGFSADRLMEPGFWEKHLHPDDRERMLGMFGEVLKAEGGRSDLMGEHRMVAADGHVVWFHTGVSGATDESGRPELHGFSVDITGLKDAETVQAVLADAGRILSETLDYRPALQRLASRMVEDVADWCLIDELVEPGRLSRLAVAHVVPAGGAPLPEVTRPEGIDLTSSAVVACVARSGQEELHEDVSDPRWLAEAVGVSAPDRGETMDARSCIFVPLAARGRNFGVMTLVSSRNRPRLGAHDIGLAKEVARRAGMAIDNARLYEQSERARRGQEGLLAIVSHDLRNPLGVIVTSVGMLERVANEERVRKYAGAISRSARRMDRLIEDLLDVAQVQAGQLAVERGVVEASALVQDGIESLRPVADQKGLRLEASVPEGLLVCCDRDRTLQAFSNLVGNAIKFTSTGGQVSVRGHRSGDEAEFAVIDTGIGIPEGDLSHIWERFWRTKKSGGGGTGLGLTITRGLVEAQGGRIWVESKVGVGTTFRFTLPLAHVEPDAKDKDGPGRAPARHRAEAHR
jgi:PAS domain S-box-containing protein